MGRLNMKSQRPGNSTRPERHFVDAVCAKKKPAHIEAAPFPKKNLPSKQKKHEVTTPNTFES